MREIPRLMKKWSVLYHLNIYFFCILNDNNLQLGMMVIAVGLSSYNVALFHLVNHALIIECM